MPSFHKTKRSSSRKQKRKAVSFDGYARVRDIEGLDDITQDDFSSLWYSRQEFETIRAEIRLTLRLAKTGVLAIDRCDDLCLRGLEGTTKSGYTHVKTNRLMALEAVLYEQERQEDEGLDSPELIAKAYFDAARQCRQAARLAGIQDAKEAAPPPKVIVKHNNNTNSNINININKRKGSKSKGKHDDEVVVTNLEDPKQIKKSESLMRKRLRRFLFAMKRDKSGTYTTTNTNTSTTMIIAF